jgi:hypothetical protein
MPTMDIDPLITDETRDALLYLLQQQLHAEGKPLPHVTEDRTSPRGKPWHRLTWESRPDLVVKIDNRGFWRLTDSGPQSLRTSRKVAETI